MCGLCSSSKWVKQVVSIDFVKPSLRQHATVTATQNSAMYTILFYIYLYICI